MLNQSLQSLLTRLRFNIGTLLVVDTQAVVASSSSTKFKFVWVPRDFNKAAHWIAKWGASSSQFGCFSCLASPTFVPWSLFEWSRLVLFCFLCCWVLFYLFWSWCSLCTVYPTLVLAWMKLPFLAKKKKLIDVSTSLNLTFWHYSLKCYLVLLKIYISFITYQKKKEVLFGATNAWTILLTLYMVCRVCPLCRGDICRSDSLPTES